MNAKRKRTVASWVLLAVFLPMLLLASLHVHPTYSVADDTCTECVHHQCGGHFTQQGAVVHACLLCQFLTLPMLGAAVVALILFGSVRKVALPLQRGFMGCAHHAPASLRAPPVFLF